MNQPASGIKRVCDAAPEDPEFQSLEQHLNTVAHARGLCAYGLKNPFKPSSTLWMIAGIIEKLVEPGAPAALPGRRPILGRSVADDWVSLQADLRNERLR